MTLNIRQGSRGVPGDNASTTKRYFPLYTGPASYVTGGDVGVTTAVGLGKIFAVLGLIASNGTTVIVGRYIPTTDALQWFDMAGAEIAPATDLSGYTATLEVIGQ